MQPVSTRWTLLFKIIIPTVWICFFGTMAILSLFFTPQVAPPFSPTTAKLLIISFSASSIGLIYLLFMRIKWVALAADGFYVSNFFRTAKYSYDSLKSIEETKILLYKRISFVLRDKGSFGEKIFFIAGYQWEYYLQKNPEIMQAIFNATSTPNLNPNDPKSLPK